MIIDELITDRTQADVDTAKSLISKALSGGWNSLSNEEKAAYMGGLKGAYNASDMNRVGEAVNYLKAMFAAKGVTVNVTGKTNWTIESIPTKALINEYLSNIRKLVEAADGYSDAKAELSGNNLRISKIHNDGLIAETSFGAIQIGTIPDDLSRATYEDFNRIELALKAIYQLLIEV